MKLLAIQLIALLPTIDFSVVGNACMVLETELQTLRWVIFYAG